MEDTEEIDFLQSTFKAFDEARKLGIPTPSYEINGEKIEASTGLRPDKVDLTNAPPAELTEKLDQYSSWSTTLRTYSAQMGSVLRSIKEQLKYKEELSVKGTKKMKRSTGEKADFRTDPEMLNLRVMENQYQTLNDLIQAELESSDKLYNAVSRAVTILTNEMYQNRRNDNHNKNQTAKPYIR